MVTPPRHRALVAEFMDPVGLRMLAAETEVTYRPTLGDDRPALLSAVRETQALIVRNRCRVDAEVLAAAGGLRVVGRLGAGLDNIDLAACRAAGVPVVYARGANADAVCEYVFAGLLHLLRRLSDANRTTHGGAWAREDFIGDELGGRTLGIVGLGEVGRRLCRRADAWGMRVLGVDPAIDEAEVVRRGLPLQLLPLEDLLAASDIVSLHLPLVPATHHLIDAAALARFRPGAILVNAARGGIVDERALSDAIASERLRGAVLDVREVEPPPQPDPLVALPGVLLTPHIAGLTRQAQTKVATMVAADVLAVLQNRPPSFQAAASEVTA